MTSVLCCCCGPPTLSTASSQASVLASSHRQHGLDKTRQFCLVRVGDVNKLLWWRRTAGNHDSCVASSATGRSSFVWTNARTPDKNDRPACVSRHAAAEQSQAYDSPLSLNLSIVYRWSVLLTPVARSTCFSIGIKKIIITCCKRFLSVYLGTLFFK